MGNSTTAVAMPEMADLGDRAQVDARVAAAADDEARVVEDSSRRAAAPRSSQPADD
jgi:hypothetical protein